MGRIATVSIWKGVNATLARVAGSVANYYNPASGGLRTGTSRNLVAVVELVDFQDGAARARGSVPFTSTLTFLRQRNLAEERQSGVRTLKLSALKLDLPYS
ncbi:hypothetical protein OUZ56_031597 [Daphnia magna]|uniref:Uncharacterized protein n=1 Tax=Daphnia magna TaxID=35525 RepID=A0ABQ9ZUN5_9CRUS|nr:hypothetical protein OUZ56_031597 [Daphnia magna]